MRLETKNGVQLISRAGDLIPSIVVDYDARVFNVYQLFMAGCRRKNLSGFQRDVVCSGTAMVLVFQLSLELSLYKELDS